MLTRFLTFIFAFFIFSQNNFAQNTISDINEKVTQKMFWEAKKDIDELMPMLLADSLASLHSAYLCKGMVYDALVRESTTSQDLFLEEAIAGYQKVLKYADSTDGEMVEQAKIRYEALYAFLYNRAVTAHQVNDIAKANFYYKMAARMKVDVNLLKNYLSAAWTVKNLPLTKSIIYDLLRYEQKSASYFKTLLFIVGENEKDYPKAIKIAEEAQLHFPQDTTFLFARVNYFTKEKSYYEALGLLEPFSEQNNLAILSNLAFLNRQIGRIYEAEKYWKKMLEMNPKDLAPCYNIGEMLYNQGVNYLKQTAKYKIIATPNKYFEEALPYLKQVHESNPKDEKIKAAYNRAKIEAKQPIKRAKKREKPEVLSVPTILITAPSMESDSFQTEETFVKIEGLLIDEDGGAEVTMNGIYGAIENDRFAVILPLKEGINKVDIVGVNFDGVKVEKTIFVHRKVAEKIKRNFLLLFGTDTFQNQASKPENVAFLTELDSLLNGQFEGFSQANTYRLIGKNANKDKILSTFRELSRQMKSEDNLVLVLAGKHHSLSASHETFWQTYDAEAQASDLPVSLIIEMLKTIPAQNQLLIVDGQLNKTFLTQAERSTHIKYENFMSRRIISLHHKNKNQSLLKTLIDLLANEKNKALSTFDMFLQGNLTNANFLDYQFWINDKDEAGDFVLKRK